MFSFSSNHSVKPCGHCGLVTYLYKEDGIISLASTPNGIFWTHVAAKYSYKYFFFFSFVVSKQNAASHDINASLSQVHKKRKEKRRREEGMECVEQVYKHPPRNIYTVSGNCLPTLYKSLQLILAVKSEEL